jgi:mitotic spindle assembly checkpoint protein MAD1
MSSILTPASKKRSRYCINDLPSPLSTAAAKGLDHTGVLLASNSSLQTFLTQKNLDTSNIIQQQQLSTIPNNHERIELLEQQYEAQVRELNNHLIASQRLFNTEKYEIQMKLSSAISDHEELLLKYNQLSSDSILQQSDSAAKLSKLNERLDFLYSTQLKQQQLIKSFDHEKHKLIEQVEENKAKYSSLLEDFNSYKQQQDKLFNERARSVQGLYDIELSKNKVKAQENQEFQAEIQRLSSLIQQLQGEREQRNRLQHELIQSQSHLETATRSLEALQNDRSNANIYKAAFDEKSHVEEQLRRAVEKLHNLTEKSQNIELIKEQLNAANEKIHRLELHSNFYAKLQIEFDEIKQRERGWIEGINTIWTEITQPKQLINKVQELYNKELLYTKQFNSLQSNHSKLNQQIQQLTEGRDAMKDELAAAHHQISELKDSSEKNLRDKEKAIKQRDSYKRILDSYDNEEEINQNNNTHINRIKELEQIISQSNQSAKGDYQVEELNSIITRLNRTIDNLTAENQHLKSQLADPSYNADNSKILHLANNPTSGAINLIKSTQLQDLQQENAALKNKLSILQERAGNNSSAVHPAAELQRVDLENAVKKLQKEYSEYQTLSISKENELEKKMMRLKEVFQSKVSEFREATYLLTGYKIELMSSSSSGLGQYKIRSMYAERDVDYLLFQYTDNSKKSLQVLETEFVKKLDQSLTIYLNKFHSIPAFTAAVTCELFQRQTST